MNRIVEKDLGHFWRPATQMKDYENYEPLLIDHALGSMLYLRDGRELIDGISSWWCKSLGHGHPSVRKAFLDQVMKFEHVIMANCSAEPVAELCATLAELLMTAGYFVFEGFYYAAFATALLAVPGNLVQGAFGVLSAVPLYFAACRSGLLRKWHTL